MCSVVLELFHPNDKDYRGISGAVICERVGRGEDVEEETKKERSMERKLSFVKTGCPVK
jgi:hypothetical protein